MNAPVAKVPPYLFEGIANSLGHRFAATTAEGTFDIGFAAKRLAGYTAADAEETIKNFSTVPDYAVAKGSGKVWQYEHLGGLFIEHLISKSAGNESSVYRAWGQLVKNVGSGMPFNSAFNNAFRMNLNDAETEFVAYMKKTENNPQARFANTVFSRAVGK
jgi:hypothetical protein